MQLKQELRGEKLVIMGSLYTNQQKLNLPLPSLCTLPAIRWLHAWSLPLFLLLTLSLPLPASPSHPSDEKEHSSPFPRNISAASLGSLITHHNSASHSHQPEPSVTDPLMGTIHSTGDAETRIDVEKNETQVGLVLNCLPKAFLFALVPLLTVVFMCSRRSRPWRTACIAPNPNMS